MPLDWVPSRDDVVHYKDGLAVVVGVKIHQADPPGVFVEIREIVEKPLRRRARRRTREERVADVLMGKEKADGVSGRRSVSLMDLSPLRMDGGGLGPGGGDVRAGVRGTPEG